MKVVDIVERAKDIVASGIAAQPPQGGRKHPPTTATLRGAAPYPRGLREKPRKAKLGYFIGCTSAYRNPSTAKATISILKKLGEDYTLLDESCCGSVMERIGWKEEDVAAQMRKNIDAIVSLGVEEVIFSCAGCYRMFKEEYLRHVDVPFKVLHVAEYLASKDLKPSKLEKKITYHDPCHLGRHTKVYKAPREVLAKIPGAQFKEMPRNAETSRCCGGGGGVRSAYPELSGQIAEKRVEEAKFADVMVTTCPFCVNNLKVGKESSKAKVEIIDLVELIEPLL